jgi:CRP/FNR family cyclic AMP-dependent transcriptional regulator
MVDRRLEILATVPLFAGSSKRQLKGLLDWTREYKYEPGHTIVREGAKGGDYFGEMAVIDGRPRMATVIADGPVDCLVLKQKDFKAVLEGDPMLAWNLLGSLAARIRHD